MSQQQINSAIEAYQLGNLDICLGKAAADAMNTMQQTGGGRRRGGQCGGCYTCEDGVAKLKAMCVDDLRGVAKKLGVKGRWAMKKDELVKAIRLASKRMMAKKNGKK
jgi:hypothetical protein